MTTISGIPCDKSVVESYRKLHETKSIRYVTYKIRRGPHSVVATVDRISKSRNDRFEDLVEITPLNEPRFILFDFSYTPYDGNVEKCCPMFILVSSRTIASWLEDNVQRHEINHLKGAVLGSFSKIMWNNGWARFYGNQSVENINTKTRVLLTWLLIVVFL